MALIVIEGIDGSGKSTQIELLQKRLEAEGKDCVKVHFPRYGEYPYGEMISSFLQGKYGSVEDVDPMLVALLYAEDRQAYKTELLRMLSEGKTVLLDRYVYSNVAYQCAKIEDAKRRQGLRDWILHLEYDYMGLPQPDINLYLDVSEQVSAKLARKRSAMDIHEESIQFQAKVRGEYCALQGLARFMLIDCMEGDSLKPQTVISDEVWRVIKEQKLI